MGFGFVAQLDRKLPVVRGRGADFGELEERVRAPRPHRHRPRLPHIRPRADGDRNQAQHGNRPLPLLRGRGALHRNGPRGSRLRSPRHQACGRRVLACARHGLQDVHSGRDRYHREHHVRLRGLPHGNVERRQEDVGESRRDGGRAFGDGFGDGRRGEPAHHVAVDDQEGSSHGG